MGILSSIFGNSKPTPESQYETLRDDGVRAMQMGEAAYAEKCLKAALDIKRELRTVSFLAEVYLRMQNYEQALPLLQEISTSDEDTLEVDLLLAQTQGKLGQYANERETCQRITQQHADEPRALYLMAEADHGLHDDFMAIAHLTQCLTLRSDYEQALFLRANVLKGMSQWNEVLTDAESLVKADAENTDYLLLRAEAYAALSKTDEAILKLGSIYQQTAQWDKALALYNEAIEQRPDFAAAYKARGAVKNHLKDVAGAAEDLKRSLELDPDKGKSLDGEYTNIENEMNDRYKRMNPYGF